MRADWLVTRWSLGLTILVLQACFAPDYPTGIPCSELDTCPPGQSCLEGICRAEPISGDPDAGTQTPDAAAGSPDAVAQPPDAAPDASPVACTSPEQCNDDIACTADSCENNVCVFTPDDSACNDEVACTTSRCDAVVGCVAEPDDSACSDGVACTTERCDVAAGCIVTPDDSACNDDIACTTERCDAAEGCIISFDDNACDDSDACTSDACVASTGCVNDDIPFCAAQCTTALIYNTAVANDLTVRAASALNITTIVTTTEADFVARFDAGGFDLVIIDAPGGLVTPQIANRTIAWVQGSGKLMFSYWNLDADASLQSALGVSTTRDLFTPPEVHADPTSPIDFFTLFDAFPSPLIATNDGFGDNGDALTLVGQGFIAARVGDPASTEGSLAVTHDNRVIVMGFLPADLFFSQLDADGDSLLDGEELYRNEMRFLCAPAL